MEWLDDGNLDGRAGREQRRDGWGIVYSQEWFKRPPDITYSYALYGAVFLFHKASPLIYSRSKHSEA